MVGAFCTVSQDKSPSHITHSSASEELDLFWAFFLQRQKNICPLSAVVRMVNGRAWVLLNSDRVNGSHDAQASMISVSGW